MYCKSTTLAKREMASDDDLPLDNNARLRWNELHRPSNRPNSPQAL